MTAYTSRQQQTRLVRGGIKRTGFRETSEPIFINSGYVFPEAEVAEAAFKGENDAYVYSRYGNPTSSVLEERLALLEGADLARATASGMSAVFSALACQLEVGDRVVAAKELFGSSVHIVTKILPKWGVEVDFVKGSDLAAWKDALSKPAKVVFFESPSNPMLDLVDIEAVSEFAHKAGARMVIDNVFATPLFQKPLALGADVVVYSATKHLDGQGRCMGGAVLGDRQFMDHLYIPFYRNTGPSISPFNAWILSKSLETLELRVERMTETAAHLADWLEAHESVKQVRYPGRRSHPQYELAHRQMSGFGSLVTFELKGGKDAAFKLLNSLEIVDISNNLGDAKSLICHPATTTHSKVPEVDRGAAGITDGVVRLSVGLEHPDDLIADLSQALFRLSA